MNNNINQRLRPRSEFITPSRILKKKVGSGGLPPEILEEAEELLENHALNFEPFAETYISNLMDGIELAKQAHTLQTNKKALGKMLYAAMQIKANGRMFHYPLATNIAHDLIQFLEDLDSLNMEALEITLAFHSTLRGIIKNRIKGEGGDHGTQLSKVLDQACTQYFEQNKQRTKL